MILKMKYYSGRQVHNIITETIAGKTLADVLERFAKEPSADVQEIRRGRWIRTGEDGYCSACKCDMPMFRNDWEWEYTETPYCPNCGADMTEEEEA